MLYELLKSSPRLEQVQTVLLDWGVEQLYGLLLNGSFGDEVRERVFRVRGAALAVNPTLLLLLLLLCAVISKTHTSVSIFSRSCIKSSKASECLSATSSASS